MDVMAQGWGTVATILAPHLEASQANAARIVACVNACAGIPTEQLGDVRALVEGLEGMLHFFMGYSDMEAWKKADAALAPFREK